MAVRTYGSLVVMLAVLLALVGCSFNVGSGTIIDENRPVSGFSRISVAGPVTVIVEENGNESLTISADDNLLPSLTAAVSNNTLELAVEPGVSIGPTQNVVYRISVKDLRSFSLTGSGEADLKNIDTDELTIEIAGSGQITVSGHADTQIVDVSGSGDYVAETLESSAATITLSGSGSAVVNASQTLDVTIDGSGNVEYLGDPTVKQELNGSGGVQKR